ncbi:MAG: phage terminase large subunit, partial [Polyangiaceae bacterium]|nr:phage terminase large subunit [Polyangiaceae bacterium]
LQHPGAVVLVMTRWHEDDLAGRLINDGGESWTVLNLPTLAEPGDTLGRNEGEPLCPGLGYDKAWAQRTRAVSGGYWWSALYQQRPAPPEGLMFKRHQFRYWRDQPGDELYLLEQEDGSSKPIGKEWCIHFQTVDVAASEKTSADWTVISTWAATPDRDLLLVDRERQRFEVHDVGGFVRRAYNRQDPRPDFIGVEDFGHGLGVVQELNREGLPIRRLRPDKDKLSRALVAVARYDEHRVFHPRHVHWLSEWEDELIAFPNAAHDDQVDTVAYAARLLTELPAPNTITRKRPHRPGELAGIRHKAL